MTRSPGTSAFSRLPLGLRVLLLLSVPWAAWVANATVRTRLNGLLELGFLVVLYTMAPVLLWKASRRPDLPEAFRGALRWISAGLVMALLQGLYVLVHDVLLYPHMGRAVLGIPDLLALAAYPLVMLGQLRFPRAQQPLPRAGRILLDSATFILGVGVPLWVFGLLPTLANSSPLEKFVSLAFPSVAFLGIVVVNFVLLRCVPLPSRGAFNLLLAGTTLSWVSDLFFSLVAAGNLPFPNLGHILNLLNGASYLLITLGAWRMVVDPAPVQEARPAAFSPIPMITIVAVAVWLARFLQHHELSTGTIQRILAGIIPLLFILLLREGLAARDGIRQATAAVTLRLRARFEALVQHSTELILVVDQEGALAFFSPAAARLFGASGGATAGRPLADFIHPQDLATWSAFLAELQALPEEARSIQQWRMRAPEGEWRTFEASGSNLLQDPDVGGLVLNARDITDRRQLEEHLRQVLKMEALGRLAGGVAHDFNNLLSAILGNVELSRMKLDQNHPLLDRLARIEDAATRGAKLTGRLLAFTRRESQDLEVLDTGAWLEGLLPLIQGLVGGNVELELQVEPGTGAFRANRGDVEQGLLGLVINAKDAMPGGGRILLRARNGDLEDPARMDFLSAPPGPCVVLEVADTGLGMDAQVRSHLFEPFFTTKGGGQGTGLGLVGVYGMMKAAQGGIVVRSEPGRGTCFELWFPRVAAEVAEARPVDRPTLLRGQESILLVEDEEAVREATEEILSSMGYRVLVAASAEAARALLASHAGDLDLLVTDVIMPGDSGPKLAAELVQARPGLRVLYISGYTADELASHGLAHPGAPLLEKPFTIQQLGQRVRELLDRPQVPATP